MIDTDKYEGHIKGPWRYILDEQGMVIMAGETMVAELSHFMSNMSPETDEINPSGLDPDAVDAQLIADAPLLLAEVKRLREKLECWDKLLEVYGINNERMSAALSFAFGDSHESMSYLENILHLDERDLKWYREIHGDEEE